MARTLRPFILLVLMLSVVSAGCGSTTTSGDGSSTSTTASSATTTVVASPSTTTSASGGDISNTWASGPVDLTKLPIGTSHVSTSTATVGGLFVCDGGNPNGGGAFRAGPWLNETAGTWDATKKVAVNGKVSWPMAKYTESIEGAERLIDSNGLPVGEVTGTFPIAASDPAFAYDRNPNSIAATTISLRLPATPTAAASPSCLTKGMIGVLRNGVALYAPVDERNRDAVAHETQDECDGHPQQSSTYHYHDVPSCVLAAATGPSTVVGFATDGFPIVVERDAAGNLPTNADLDRCHGRVSPISLDGKVVASYHYSATREFPYFIGCFAGSRG